MASLTTSPEMMTRPTTPCMVSGAPVIRNPSAAVVLNLPSLEKYGPLVNPGGVLVVNTSLIPKTCERDDIRIISIPASDIASELGNTRMANLVLLGALIEATGIVSMETIEQQLEEHLSERHRKWLEPNKQALRKGASLAK